MEKAAVVSIKFLRSITCYHCSEKAMMQVQLTNSRHGVCYKCLKWETTCSRNCFTCESRPNPSPRWQNMAAEAEWLERLERPNEVEDP